MHHRECESVRMNESKVQWIALLQSSIHWPACGLLGTAELLPHKVEAFMQQTQELCLTIHIHLDERHTDASTGIHKLMFFVPDHLTPPNFHSPLSQVEVWVICLISSNMIRQNTSQDNILQSPVSTAIQMRHDCCIYKSKEAAEGCVLLILHIKICCLN